MSNSQSGSSRSLVASAVPPAPVISVYKAGEEADSKRRITVPRSWDTLLAKIKKTLAIPVIGKLTDSSGARIEFLEVIRDGDVLCVTPGSTAPPPVKVSRRVSSGTSTTAAAPTTGDRRDVLDIQILGCAHAADFELVAPVAGGQNGFIFKALCHRAGLSDPTKPYALKVVYNFGVATNAMRNSFENEFRVLSQLPPHPHVTRFWAQFTDEVPDEVLPHMPEFTREQARYRDHRNVERRRKCQFLVVDYHPTTLKDRVTSLTASSPSHMLPVDVALSFIADLLRAVTHFNSHAVAHLDLKLDNILVADDGRLVVCDFGTAVRFRDSSMSLDFVQGMSVGGNQLHLAPEVLNAYNRLQRRSDGGVGGTISYSHQGVWAVAVIAYQLCTGHCPWPDYPNECGEPGNIHYDIADLAPISAEFPVELWNMLRSMLAFEPDARPTAAAALAQLEELVSSHDRATADHTPGSSSAPGVNAAATPQISVLVRTVSGAAATVHVPGDATVGDLKARAAEVLEPVKLNSDHSFLLLHGGHKLGDHVSVSSLRKDDSTCFHLVALSTQSNSGESKFAVNEEEFVCKGFSPRFKSPHLSLSPDCQRVSAVKWGSAKIDLNNGYWLSTGRKYSWALKVVNKAAAGGICIGVCSRHFDAVRKNVGAAPHSWGYSSSGKKSAGSPTFEPYAHGFNTGDVLRCDLDLVQRTLSFSLNGVDLGVAFRNLPPDLIPAVCMGASGAGVGVAAHQLMIIRTEHEYDSMVAEMRGDSEAQTDDVDEALAPPPPREDYLFHDTAHSRHASISADRAIVSMKSWGSALLQYPIMKPGTGIHLFRFKVLQRAPSGGVCIGVCNQLFNAQQKNVGAAANSWGYSCSGKKGDGKGFVPYGSTFTSGDVVGMLVDTVAGTVRFSLNGEDQGIAFRGLEAQSLHAAVCCGGVKSGDEQQHQVMSLEIPRVFDPETKQGHLRVVAEGMGVKADSHGLIALSHSGMRVGQHVWQFKVTATPPMEPLFIGVAEKQHLGRLTSAPTLRGGWYYGSSGRKAGPPGKTEVADFARDSRFTAYGAVFKKGDTIGVLWDADVGTLRFSLNGHDQGPAFRGLRGKSLVPVVVLGGRPSYPAKQGLELVPSVDSPTDTPTYRFDTSLRNEHIVLSPDHMVASGTAWGSFAVTRGPLRGGVHTFRFQIMNKAPSGGICVGCVTASFDISTKNVAAAPGSWGYSSSGKKNNGDRAFVPYGAPYTTGDVIEMLLDLDNGRVSFSKNGVPQGIAYQELTNVPVTPAVCVGGAAPGFQHQVKLLPTSNTSAASMSDRVVKFSPWLKHQTVVISDDQMSVAMTSWGSVVLAHGGITSGRHEFKFLIAQKAPSGGVCVGVVDNAQFDATSKNSAGFPTFVEYASSFTTGDIVGVVVDMDEGTISFSVNGQDQGVAFNEGVTGRVLVPAVCGGGAINGQAHRISVVEPCFSFDPDLASSHAKLSEDHTRLLGQRVWASAGLTHSGMSHGKFVWSIKITRKVKSGGICLGIVDRDRFNFATQNVGADRHSWGYSSLGSRNDGSPDFEDYGSPFGTGDVITVVLDMDDGWVRFIKNGVDEGVAFSTGIKGRTILPAVCVGGAKTSCHEVEIIPFNVTTVAF